MDIVHSLSTHSHVQSESKCTNPLFMMSQPESIYKIGSVELIYI